MQTGYLLLNRNAPYNGNNPTLIIQKYYATVDESRSAITVPSHYGEDLDAVKEDLEKEWKEYAKNIDEEMKKRPEKDGKADEMTVTFTEAANRENIVTGEKASTLMGKIKKWLADLAAAAFMQVVTSYSDLMAGTALDNYLIGAAAAKEGFTELNGKLETKEEFVNEGTIVSKTGNHVTLNGSQYIQSVTYTIPGWGTLKIGTMSKQYVPSRALVFYTQVRNSDTSRIYYIGIIISINGDISLYNAASDVEITFSQIGFSFGWDV